MEENFQPINDWLLEMVPLEVLVHFGKTLESFKLFDSLNFFLKLFLFGD